MHYPGAIHLKPGSSLVVEVSTGCVPAVQTDVHFIGYLNFQRVIRQHTRHHKVSASGLVVDASLGTLIMELSDTEHVRVSIRQARTQMLWRWRASDMMDSLNLPHSV